MFKYNLIKTALLGSGLLLLASPVKADSQTMTYSQYNGLGQAQKVVNSNGRTTTYNYDSEGRVLAMTLCGTICGSSNDYTVNYSYEDGQLKTVTHPDGRVETNTYDVRGYLKSTTLTNPSDANSPAVSNFVTKNVLGWTTSYTDFNGVMASFTGYDKMGRSTVIEVNSNSATESFISHMKYSPLGYLEQTISNVGGNSHETLQTDTKYALVGTKNKYQPIEQLYTWQQQGSSTVYQLKVTYSYDALGRKLSQTIHSKNPDNGNLETYTTQYAYQFNVTDVAVEGCQLGGCKLTSTTFINGGVKQELSDTMGRLVKIVEPRGETTLLHYNEFDQIVKTVTGAATLDQTYNSVANDIQKRSAEYMTTLYTYSVNHQLESTITFMDVDTSEGTQGIHNGDEVIISQQSFSYNDLGLKESERSGDTITGVRQVFGYDEALRLNQIWELTGGSGANIVGFDRHNKTVYDSIGRVSQSIVAPDTPDQLLTTYGYDNDKLRVKYIDGPRTDTSDFIRYNYTIAGRLDKITNGAGKDTKYDYDILGRLISVKRPDIDTMTFSYDGFGRVMSEAVGGKTQTWAYWPDGRLHTQTDFAGKTTQHRYNTAMQLAHLDRAPIGITPSSDDITYGAYDSNGNVHQITDYQTNIAGQLNELFYDALGRLVTVDRNGIHTSEYQYANTGNSSTTHQVGLNNKVYSTEYVSDTVGRLSKVLTSRDGVTLSDHRFSYRSVGLSQTMRAHGPTAVTSNYQFNKAGQVAAIAHGNGSWDINYGYSYTGGFVANINESGTQSIYGNRSLIHDANNRMTSIDIAGNTTSYDYNADGSIASFPDIGAMSYDTAGWLNMPTYPLDSAGNMQTTKGKSGDWNLSYDSANRLIQSTKGSKTINHQYDALGNKVRTCHTVSGTETCTDLVVNHLNGKVVAMQSGSDLTWYTFGAMSELLHEYDDVSNSSRYFLADHQASVIASFDSSGNWTGQKRYSPYGAVVQDTIGNLPFGYTSEFEQADGTLYLRARHYNPQMGIFLQRDTYPGAYQKPNSLQRFAYVEGAPLSYVDPSGHLPQLPPEIPKWTDLPSEGDPLWDRYQEERGRLSNQGLLGNEFDQTIRDWPWVEQQSFPEHIRQLDQDAETVEKTWDQAEPIFGPIGDVCAFVTNDHPICGAVDEINEEIENQTPEEPKPDEPTPTTPTTPTSGMIWGEGFDCPAGSFTCRGETGGNTSGSWVLDKYPDGSSCLTVSGSTQCRDKEGWPINRPQPQSSLPDNSGAPQNCIANGNTRNDFWL